MTAAFGQPSKKFVGYLSIQYNKTVYDPTVPNNPWAMGLGVQSFFNDNSKMKINADLTADACLEDDKVLRSNRDSTSIPDVGGMVNLFVGASITLQKQFIYHLWRGQAL